MASAAYNRSFAVRASAVLTTGEVNGNYFDLNEANVSDVVVEIAFVKGSLTNGIFRFYASVDGTTWVPLADAAAGAVSYTYTADTSIAIPVRAPGYKFLRVSTQGTGTVTSSTAAVNLRYLRRGAQRL